ncbi:casein kinase substrate phospho protein PP28-domain-containing protein [Schizophyllum amplum]|uniref:Casein kinase substrate phospho protein PP28-domain-containing protein n=1 Tax=Schizophyllum amplum TaxID=97359 RepID=A0A550CEP6_9AGAR|nr:casein kinase substrate phospho protein PP28-domain-containing protein [Auriculariopsis ampla]
MVRGTGKFKQKRGGGRQFSKTMVLDENGTAVSTDRRWAPRDKKGSDDDSDEESEEEEEEESEEEEEGGEDKPGQQELSRTERREMKKKQAAEKAKKTGEDGEDDDEDLINPNHVTKKMNIADLGAPRQLSRREREAKEKKEAQDRYWKLHVAGKTDEAKTDLARLAKIREERAAALEKRKAEQEAKNVEIEQKRLAQMQRKRG